MNLELFMPRYERAPRACKRGIQLMRNTCLAAVGPSAMCYKSHTMTSQQALPPEHHSNQMLRLDFSGRGAKETMCNQNAADMFDRRRAHSLQSRN
jgi:hypothetical protein